MKNESNGELKEIDIKNCTCNYFDDIIKIEDLGFDHILLNGKLHKKLYRNILVYNIPYKTSMSTKPSLFWLDNVDVFITDYDGTTMMFLN